MALRNRRRIPPTDNWQQLELLVDTPGQRSYEVIRPVVLFGEPIPERATSTQTQTRTIYRYLTRFEATGLSGLEPPPKVDRHLRVLEEIRRAIIDLKREHPPLHIREISTICWARFGHRLSHHTVHRILAEHPSPPRVVRRLPLYHTLADPFARRRAVLQLHVEGWNNASIAAYLETSRPTVDDILRRWVEEQFAGLHDQSRRPQHLQQKQTLQALLTAKKLQEHPELGEFRLYAALKEQGIALSPRTCGRILALNRKLYGLPKPTKGSREPKSMPFAAQYRHQAWTADLRYIDHHLGNFNVYCLSILENYSRAVLANELSLSQDLSAWLRVLRQAVEHSGTPAMLVSDRGSIFLAERAQRIYRELGIQKAEIARHQPWQSYIETMFNVQRRMANWDFGKATSMAELALVHSQWVEDYNRQDHWAHRKREDGRASPKAVLDWVQGREVSAAVLEHAFAPVQFPRRADRWGYIRFRRWRLYGERGLARKKLGLWLTGEHLTVVYSDEPLAQYAVTYERDHRHLKTVQEARLYLTPFQSPQPHLWEPREGEWLKVLRLRAVASRRRRHAVGEQPPLFAVAE
ncbi:MAG: helix-turn-helix domain-containing protein [Dehalococcoidia bacterium]